MSSENTPTQKRTTDEIKTLLELPFRAAEITWRVLGDGEKTEGEARIIPYAYRAAYMRRLDILFGPGGWTQSFSMTTVSNIQRSKKVNKAYAMITTGKILVTSTITIEGFGTRSSTGEGWADDENGTTRAQAQAFRRACAEFGLGRYLRELEGWNCKVPVNAKGYFKRPHFSVLPDSAIHPSELAEAQEARSHTAKSSRKPAAPAPVASTRGGNQPPSAVASSPPNGDSGCDRYACFWLCPRGTGRSTNGGCRRHRNPARGVANPGSEAAPRRLPRPAFQVPDHVRGHRRFGTAREWAHEGKPN